MRTHLRFSSTTGTAVGRIVEVTSTGYVVEMADGSHVNVPATFVNYDQTGL